MNNLQALETELNKLVAAGKILEAVDRYFAEDCSFQEGNQPPRVGKATQHAHLEGFFKTLKAFNGATLHSQAVGDNVTLSEWTFDMVGPDGPMIWNEVLRRRWKDGKVISERFYTAA
ncbi:MAG: nuclear transport factor 2 family protein [Blastocatellia bacterium]